MAGLIYLIWAIPICFLVIGTTLVAVVARLEKRMVWPYGEFRSEPEFVDASGYGARFVNEAIQSGFSFLGWASDLKGARYKVSYAMLISPAKDCLVVIGVGQIYKLPLMGTWIHSISSDARHSWYSTDNQACVEFDISGCKKSQLVLVKSFGLLWQKHQDWVSKTAARHAFMSLDNLEVFRKFRAGRYREMASKNLIVYGDAEKIWWRYTWYGAIKLSVLNHCIGLLRSISSGRFPKSA